METKELAFFVVDAGAPILVVATSYEAALVRLSQEVNGLLNHMADLVDRTGMEPGRVSYLEGGAVGQIQRVYFGPEGRLCGPWGDFLEEVDSCEWCLVVKLDDERNLWVAGTDSLNPPEVPVSVADLDPDTWGWGVDAAYETAEEAVWGGDPQPVKA